MGHPVQMLMIRTFASLMLQNWKQGIQTRGFKKYKNTENEERKIFKCV